MVNDDVHEIHDRRIAEIKQLLEKTLTALCPNSNMMNGVHEDLQEDVVILDPLRTPRKQVVALTASTASLVAAAQQLPDGTSLALVQTDERGLGKVVESTPSAYPTAKSEGNDVYTLSNEDFKLVIEDGRIASLIDLRLDRELIQAGPGAETAGLMLYDDLPLAYDAWDAEIYHLDCAETLRFQQVEVVAEGRLRASLKATCTFGSSKVELTVSSDV